MGLLSKDAILNVDDREYVEVEIPEWGGSVRLRSLSGKEYDKFQKDITIQRGGDTRVRWEGLRTRLIVLCAVDENGSQLFSEDDVTALSRKNSKPIDRLFEKCQTIIGMSKEDIDKLTEDFDESQS